MMFVISGYILIVYFGYLITGLFLRKASLPERLGIAYLLGIGLSTLLVFYFSMLGIKIDLLSLTVFMMPSLFLLRTISKKLVTKIEWRRLAENFVLWYRNLSCIDKVILFTLFLFCLLSLLIASYQPITAWDALALYDFRAKIIASQGYFVQIVGNFSYFAHYPLLTSLGHAFVYLLGGHNPQFIYPLFLISLILIFYSQVKKHYSSRISLISCLYLVTTPIFFEHSTIAYTNLPYAVYFSLGTIYLYRFLVERNKSYLVTSSLLVGLSTWARSDYPFWAIPLVFVIMYSVINKKLSSILIYLLIFLSIQQPWRIFQASLFGKTYTTLGQFSYAIGIISKGVNFSSLLNIIEFVYRNIIVSWGILFYLFLIVIILELKNLVESKRWILVMLIFISLFSIIIGTYVFSGSFGEWKEIPDSAKRMSMFFIPLFIYYIATSKVIRKIIPKNERK